MNKISFDVNNCDTLELVQREHDGTCLIVNSDHDIPDNEAFISAGDMVMLLNFYRYVKRHDIQNDFINPSGKK